MLEAKSAEDFVFAGCAVQLPFDSHLESVRVGQH